MANSIATARLVYTGTIGKWKDWRYGQEWPRIEELIAECGLTTEFNELLTEHGLPQGPSDFARWAICPQAMENFELRREAMYKALPIQAIDKIRPHRPKKVEATEGKSPKTHEPLPFADPAAVVSEEYRQIAAMPELLG
jgi:hypothetical protein